jgi:hypothetical protein
MWAVNVIVIVVFSVVGGIAVGHGLAALTRSYTEAELYRRWVPILMPILVLVVIYVIPVGIRQPVSPSPIRSLEHAEGQRPELSVGQRPSPSPVPGLQRASGEEGNIRSPAPPLPWYTASHALVVWMRRYTGIWAPLNGAEKDGLAVARILRSEGFVVETASDLNLLQLQESLARFIQNYGSNPNNRLLFYLAGHGYNLKPTGDGPSLGFFVTIAAPDPLRDLRGFRSAALSLQRVTDYALQIDAKHALFIFDSCFSGNIFHVSSVNRAPSNASIVDMISKPVKQFITSGREDETVPDESMFSRCFLTALRNKAEQDKVGEYWADVNGDGYVTGTELGRFLARCVEHRSGKTQHPLYGSFKDLPSQGDIVFRIVQGPPEEPETPPLPPLPSSLVIYSDERPAAGWADASWDARIQYNVTDYAYHSTHAIKAVLEPYGGLALSNRNGVNTKPYNKLQFKIHGGDTGGQALKLYVNAHPRDGVRTQVTLKRLLPTEWQTVSVPLEDLDASNITIYKINISETLGIPQPAFYVDDIRLVNDPSSPPLPGPISYEPAPPSPPESRRTAEFIAPQMGERVPQFVDVHYKIRTPLPSDQRVVLLVRDPLGQYWSWGTAPTGLQRRVQIGVAEDTGKEFELVLLLTNTTIPLGTPFQMLPSGTVAQAITIQRR